eukprot:354050-Chlamydomonas_euryale.AAC.11
MGAGLERGGKRGGKKHETWWRCRQHACKWMQGVMGANVGSMAAQGNCTTLPCREVQVRTQADKVSFAVNHSGSRSDSQLKQGRPDWQSSILFVKSGRRGGSARQRVKKVWAEILSKQGMPDRQACSVAVRQPGQTQKAGGPEGPAGSLRCLQLPNNSP